MKTTLYAYQINPVDWWAGALTLQEVMDRIRAEGLESRLPWPGDPDPEGHEEPAVARLLGLYEAARVAAYEAGWEGDIRTGPYAWMLPNPDGGGELEPFAFAWKQDNNGATFVVSKVALPHLVNSFTDEHVVEVDV